MTRSRNPIRDDRFVRLKLMITEKGLDRLARAHVAIVGLGAVGSYAVEALARSGIGRLRLVDFDVIKPSNINRQLYALQSTLGMSKTEVAGQRVLDINPDCLVEPLPLFAHIDTFNEILSGPPDLIVDAIDSMTPKTALLSAAVQRNIPVISCMGAALRTDPGCIRVGPLSLAHHCPLAARIRKRLHRDGLQTDFTCVYSIEPTDHLPTGVVTDRDEPETLTRGRPRRILGSLPTLTGIIGLTAANIALELLLGDLWPQKKNPTPHGKKKD